MHWRSELPSFKGERLRADPDSVFAKMLRIPLCAPPRENSISLTGIPLIFALF